MSDRERLTSEEARHRLEELLGSKGPRGRRRVTMEKRERVRFLAGLDAWPPKDPHGAALRLLDPDEAPGAPGDGTQGRCDPSLPYEASKILFAYQAHLDFEAGRQVGAATARETIDYHARTYERHASSREARAEFASFRRDAGLSEP